ncbi:UNVERIFIED_CONTAM: hypothetical protein HDU68_004070 [Siphonaria sp. JEL0065]|nr:hypothetical protein HDU68_004070 [Siphonaria sp. JEL0065]
MVLVSSASSKTSFCFGQLARDSGFKVIGLTSKKNLEWTRGLGVYDSVVGYDEIATLKHVVINTKGVIYVDVAGDVSIKKRVIAAAGGSRNVKKVVGVGISHFDPQDNTTHSPTPESHKKGGKIDSELFFAPEWIKKRIAQVGHVEVLKGVPRGWGLLMSRVKDWIKFQEFEGLEEGRRVYLDLLDDKARPSIGYIITQKAGNGMKQNAKL